VSTDAGRNMYRDTRHPHPPPLDAGALRRSRIARGRAMYRAARGNRDARAALLASAAEDTETPPAPAA